MSTLKGAEFTLITVDDISMKTVHFFVCEIRQKQTIKINTKTNGTKSTL